MLAQVVEQLAPGGRGIGAAGVAHQLAQLPTFQSRSGIRPGQQVLDGGIAAAEQLFAEPIEARQALAKLTLALRQRLQLAADRRAVGIPDQFAQVLQLAAARLRLGDGAGIFQTPGQYRAELQFGELCRWQREQRFACI